MVINITIVGLLVCCVGGFLLWKASKQSTVNKNFVDLKHKELDMSFRDLQSWYHACNEIKLNATKGIEVWIQTLNGQADNLDRLVSELEEQKETTQKNTDHYKEVVRYLRMNKESLKNTEKEIDRLENWYFQTYGRHYMIKNHTQYFTDQSKTSSKN